MRKVAILGMVVATTLFGPFASHAEDLSSGDEAGIAPYDWAGTTKECGGPYTVPLEECKIEVTADAATGEFMADAQVRKLSIGYGQSAAGRGIATIASHLATPPGLGELRYSATVFIDKVHLLAASGELPMAYAWIRVLDLEGRELALNYLSFDAMDAGKTHSISVFGPRPSNESSVRIELSTVAPAFLPSVSRGAGGFPLCTPTRPPFVWWGFCTGISVPYVGATLTAGAPQAHISGALQRLSISN